MLGRSVRSITLVAVLSLAAWTTATAVAGSSASPVRGAAVPRVGAGPHVLSAKDHRALERAMHKPREQARAPARQPAHGTFSRPIGSAASEHGHAYWTGSRLG